ncbi:hypothetical protein HYH03_003714 [Edaphochlamys debaryana]|uniref:Uncharacterized protein n=1 Tax=Edaphochlamys debaryana TaxID=47281 RepID=A0A836C367_9CHLO|nr:hypothetical protein HYH03_003714 [Edaphochlamys debaryana]|eukprot:KAG2498460.1 hypothetical protein HYH03_003714 [Edaphochlamys debaryana]
MYGDPLSRLAFTAQMLARKPTAPAASGSPAHAHAYGYSGGGGYADTLSEPERTDPDGTLMVGDEALDSDDEGLDNMSTDNDGGGPGGGGRRVAGLFGKGLRGLSAGRSASPGGGNGSLGAQPTPLNPGAPGGVGGGERGRDQQRASSPGADGGEDMYDTGAYGGYAAVGAGGPSGGVVGGKRCGRRPVQFWAPFNDWWRSELERTGKRPSSDIIGAWHGRHAAACWGAEAPSLEETRTHAKCLRSVGSIREYFRTYRARKKAKQEDVPAPDGRMVPVRGPGSKGDGLSGLAALQSMAAPGSSVFQPLNPIGLAHLQVAAAAVAAASASAKANPAGASAAAALLGLPDVQALAAAAAAGRMGMQFGEGASAAPTLPDPPPLMTAPPVATTITTGGAHSGRPPLGPSGAAVAAAAAAAAAAGQAAGPPVRHNTITTSSHGGDASGGGAAAMSGSDGGAMAAARMSGSGSAAGGTITTAPPMSLCGRESVQEDAFSFRLASSGSEGAKGTGPAGFGPKPPLLPGLPHSLQLQFLSGLPMADGAAMVSITPRMASGGHQQPGMPYAPSAFAGAGGGGGSGVLGGAAAAGGLERRGVPSPFAVSSLNALVNGLAVAEGPDGAAGQPGSALQPVSLQSQPPRAPEEQSSLPPLPSLSLLPHVPPAPAQQGGGDAPSSAPDVNMGLGRSPSPPPASPKPGQAQHHHHQHPPSSRMSPGDAVEPDGGAALAIARQPRVSEVTVTTATTANRSHDLQMLDDDAQLTANGSGGSSGSHGPSLRALMARPDHELPDTLRSMPHETLVVLLQRAVVTVRQKKAHEEKLMDELAAAMEAEGNLTAQLHSQRMETARLYRTVMALRDARSSGGGNGQAHGHHHHHHHHHGTAGGARSAMGAAPGSGMGAGGGNGGGMGAGGGGGAGITGSVTCPNSHQLAPAASMEDAAGPSGSHQRDTVGGGGDGAGAVPPRDDAATGGAQSEPAAAPAAAGPVADARPSRLGSEGPYPLHPHRRHRLLYQQGVAEAAAAAGTSAGVGAGPQSAARPGAEGGGADGADRGKAACSDGGSGTSGNSSAF